MTGDCLNTQQNGDKEGLRFRHCSHRSHTEYDKGPVCCADGESCWHSARLEPNVREVHSRKDQQAEARPEKPHRVGGPSLEHPKSERDVSERQEAKAVTRASMNYPPSREACVERLPTIGVAVVWWARERHG